MNKMTLCLLSLLGACALDHDEVVVEEIEQGVSSTALSIHTCAASSYCTFNLGPTATSTCVLAGVTGKLTTDGWVVGANIAPNGPNWQLTIQSSDEGLTAKVLCVSATANRVQVVHDQNWFNPQTNIQGSAAQRCFLSGVVNFDDTGFSTFDSLVKVEGEYSSWTGEMTHTVTSDLPSGSDVDVYVTCVDVAGDNGVWGYSNGSFNTVSGNLAQNPRTGGVACGLTALGGIIDDEDDGVAIGYAAATRQWSWTFEGFGRAAARCFR